MSEEQSSSQPSDKNFTRTLLPQKLINNGAGFVDLKWIKVSSGCGGDGGISFLKSASVPMGPPSGGNGGRGGDVVIVASKDITSLNGLQNRYKAVDGGPGTTKNMHGKDGPTLEIVVPVGTVIRQVDSLEEVALRRRRQREMAIADAKLREICANDLAQEEPFADLDSGAAVGFRSDGDCDAETLDRQKKDKSSENNGSIGADATAVSRSANTTQTIQTNPNRIDHEEHHVAGDDTKVAERYFRENQDRVERLQEISRHFKFSPGYLPQDDRIIMLRERIAPAAPPPPRIHVDLTANGQRHVILRGGKGGQGNPHFVINGIRGPQFAGRGETGQTVYLELELKTIADAGLVGLPNAGKSTFLAAVSNAHPKIASYPFTTLNPYIATIDHRDWWSMTIADIPGLVEGAHLNVGLGHTFLRHVERTSVLIYVIDIAAADPVTDLGVLKRELEAYRVGVTAKPSMIIANKADVGGSRVMTNLKDLVTTVGKDVPVVPVSAKERKNITEATSVLRSLVEKSSKSNPMCY